MKAERKIKVEMISDNPLKPEFIKKECDALNLEDDYYEVIVSGCCGAESRLNTMIMTTIRLFMAQHKSSNANPNSK